MIINLLSIIITNKKQLFTQGASSECYNRICRHQASKVHILLKPSGTLYDTKDEQVLGRFVNVLFKPLAIFKHCPSDSTMYIQLCIFT